MNENDDDKWPTLPLTPFIVSAVDYAAILDSISNPKPPTERMKRAAQRYAERYNSDKREP